MIRLIRFNKNLEGLRGLCAIVVAITHFFSFNFFGAFNSLIRAPVMHLQFAHASVLIFFIISGYVIGINHLNETFSLKGVLIYLKRRFTRIYPVYVVALFISIAFGSISFSNSQIIGHFLFLQYLSVSVIPSNPVLWSLSYEIIYYLLFILLWAIPNLNRSPINIFLFVAILLISIYYSNPILKSIAIGWIFWIIGLYLSSEKDNPVINDSDKKPIICYFLILLSTINLQSGGFFLRLLQLPSDSEQQINLTDLILLPICTLIFINVTRKNFRFNKILEITTFIIPTINVIGLICFKHNIAANPSWSYGTFFLVVSFISFAWKTNIYSFEKLEFFGKLSYSIYVYHFPIGFFLSQYLTQFFNGQLFTMIGAIIWFFTTLVLSYFMERVVQPCIRKTFIKNI